MADLEVHATDSDPVAVGWARHNLVGAGQVHCGDLFSALPGHLAGHLDLVMLNAPYVPTSGLATMPPEARLHEPRAALDGGPDGLDVQRRAIAQLGSWLAPSGAVMIETGRAQAPVTSALAQINVQVGQFVLSGEPVGKMGKARVAAGKDGNPARPIFYLELRSKERPINPDPGWGPSGQKVANG